MGEFSAEEKEAMKAEAGIAACTFVKDGMTIGIGTGSTVKYTILELGRRIREEGLNVSGIPTGSYRKIIYRARHRSLIGLNALLSTSSLMERMNLIQTYI